MPAKPAVEVCFEKRTSLRVFLFCALSLGLGCNSRQSLLREADESFQKHDYQKAAALYGKAVNLDQGYAETHYRLGLAHEKLGLAAEARADYRLALQFDPEHTGAASALADLDLMLFNSSPKQFWKLLEEAGASVRMLLTKDPNSFDGLRIAGQLNAIGADCDGALDNFQRARKIRPGDLNLMLKLAQLLFFCNHPVEAFALSDKIIATDKTYGPVYDNLVFVFMASKQFDRAEQILRTQIANNPSSGEDVTRLAEFYHTTGREPEADALLKQLVSNPDRYPHAQLLVGDYYYRIHQLDDAIREYGKAVHDLKGGDRITALKKTTELLFDQGKISEAEQIVGLLTASDAKDPHVAALKLNLDFSKGSVSNYDDLIQKLKLLVGEAPDDYLVHFGLARAYAAKGDGQSLELARGSFFNTLMHRPKYIPARLALAKLSLEGGDGLLAVLTCEEILVDDPGNVSAELLRSEAWVAMGKFDKALDNIRRVVQAHPDSLDARYELAMLCLRDKNYKEAAPNFEALRAANDPRGFVGIAECRVAEGNDRDAAQVLEEGLQRYPDQPGARIAAARVLLRLNRNNEAAALFQQALQHTPPSAGLYVQMAEAKWLAGDRDGSLAALGRAEAMNPSDPAASVEFAYRLSLMGRKDEARRKYQEILKWHPDNESAARRLARLDVEQGSHLEEAAYLTQLLKTKQSGDADALDLDGLISLDQHDVESALKIFKNLTEVSPFTALFHEHYALALQQNGESIAARKELERSAKAKSNEPEQPEKWPELPGSVMR
jgi:tetratricopeptide (TPR) repeat protein